MEMTIHKPSAALQSPYVQVTTEELKKLGKLKKGSLQIKKRNLEAKQSKVPRICVEVHAYACCSYPNPRLSKLTTLRRGNSLDQIHAYA
ncbi:hypothetical protein PIB30_107614 [Stylosanthes scabra]|uniref:Uncharacterized protein n=1 Tax=Stylosanthes scabra TaxID=79078 RepID=A0ABU6SZP6_9FABA|nr:hypothetical protein [Stylosanthes scabra]